MTFTNSKKTAIAFDPSQHDIHIPDVALGGNGLQVARLKGTKDTVAWVKPNPIQLPDGGVVQAAKTVRLHIYKADDRAKYLRHVREEHFKKAMEIVAKA
jgi:hypothetical protein